MRPVSKKRAALRRQVAPREREFIEEFPHCWYCGQPSTGIDHICRGGSRNAALSQRATWIACCWPCNKGEAGAWPVERKLAYKLKRDPHYFDLFLINEIRGRAQTSVQLVDVVEFVEVRQ